MPIKKFGLKKQTSLLSYIIQKAQAEKLRHRIEQDKIFVDFAMRYGNPSIKSKLNFLKEKGCENIIIFLSILNMLLFVTTATVCDEVYRSLMKMRWQPSLQIIPHYESENLY